MGADTDADTGIDTDGHTHTHTDKDRDIDDRDTDAEADRRAHGPLHRHTSNARPAQATHARALSDRQIDRRRQSLRRR